jgi:hypothetical protein
MRWHNSNQKENMKIEAEIKKITTDIAIDWLSNKWGDQRAIRSGHVARLAKDMRNNDFRVSPDAILRVKGKLANGQHRLTAVVECGKAQSFLVLESNDEELYKVVDCGLRRRVGDALIGTPYSNQIASAARWVRAYDLDVIVRSQGGTGNMLAEVTQTELINYCLENQMVLVEAIQFCHPIYDKTRLMPLSLAGALHVIANQHNKGIQVEDFLREVFIGGGKQSAATDLRNRLTLNKGTVSKMPSGYIFGISLKAFRSFCQGSRPGVLKWIKGEEFPKL